MKTSKDPLLKFKFVCAEVLYDSFQTYHYNTILI